MAASTEEASTELIEGGADDLEISEGPDESDEATDDTESEVLSESEPEAGVAEPEAGADTTHPWRRRVLAAVMVLALIAAVAGPAFLGWKLWQSYQVTQAGEAAQRAAVSYAQVLTSIYSNKVDENFAQVLDGATGEFKDMYSQSSVELRQLLIDNKAAAHGVVVESAVQSASKNKVVVLLFVDQSVSNTNVPDARIDRSRIKMTMEYVDGRWRASKVELP